MYSKIKRLWRHIHIRFYNEYNVADFYRSTCDVKIGVNCRIMDRRLGLFGGEPYLIEVGNNVTFAEDVKLITHDGGVGILRIKYPGLNVFGKIIIHDNCFIGVNSVIMPNVEIGENSVIGAGAVVTKNVLPDTVVGGVPAKRICSKSEYEKKSITKGVMINNQSYKDKKKIIEEYFNNIESNLNQSD